VDFLLYAASLDASVATRSKMSKIALGVYSGRREASVQNDIPLTNELRMDMARFEIPVSGWTCFRTKEDALARSEQWMSNFKCIAPSG